MSNIFRCYVIGLIFRLDLSYLLIGTLNVTSFQGPHRHIFVSPPFSQIKLANEHSQPEGQANYATAEKVTHERK